MRLIMSGRGIITGAISGVILGSIAISLDIGNVSTIFGVLRPNPINLGLAGIALGALISGATAMRLIPHQSRKLVPDKEDTTIKLRAEQLDITKQQIQTGEVDIYKDVHQDFINITIPVTREELVVESKISGGDKETIRIPLREESIDVQKHSVKLNDVLIYNEQIEEIERVEETLKKEVLNIETTGRVQ